MNARKLLLLLVPVVALACTSVAPVKVTAGEQCFRCRRVIGDVQVAAEIVNGTLATKYRGPGCLAKYLAAHTDENGALFVTDYTTSRMLRAENAVYVPVVVDRNTNETDYRAYKLRTEADAAARELKVAAVDWKTVREQAQ